MAATSHPDASADKAVRRDVLRNRERVVSAASDSFAEHGLDVGYDEIARRAGIGVGTVYRRFPERADLIVAVFEARIDDMVKLAADAHEQPTGAAALTWFLEQVLTVQARDRGLRDVFAGRAPRDDRMASIRARLTPAVEPILVRAKSENALRLDITVSDIAALTTALSLLHTPAQPELWRRYLTLVLDGFAPHRDGVTPLPLAAPARDDMDDLVRGDR